MSEDSETLDGVILMDHYTVEVLFIPENAPPGHLTFKRKMTLTEITLELKGMPFRELPNSQYIIPFFPQEQPKAENLS